MIFAERVPGHGGQARGEVWGALPRQHHHPGPGIQVSQRAGVQAILLRYAATGILYTLHSTSSIAASWSPDMLLQVYSTHCIAL